jgi:hypothetical protein
VSPAATVNRSELAEKARAFPVATFRMAGLGATAIGLVLLLLSARGHSARLWQAYHFNFLYWVALAQALVIFAATQKLAKGHWAGLLIRFAEAGVAFLFVALVLYLGLFLGRGVLFAHMPVDRPQVGFWFGSTFFLIRNWLILAGMAWLSWRFVRRDMAGDVAELASGTPAVDDAAAKGRVSRDAAIMVIAWGFGYSMLAFDMVMSLSPRWISNLYGAFFFMGSFLSALMGLAVLGLGLRRSMGLEHLISRKQLHDLGKLAFGFTVFWGYLMWAQFLVIWYGNLPEETYFIWYRLWGAWRPVGVLVFLLVFVVPFIGLLGAKPKQRPAWFSAMALVSLTGIWLERYVEVVPSLNNGAGPAFGFPELGALLFFAGLFALAYAWFAGRYPMVSPRLAADTLQREQGH